jgi:hypothetical protein
MFKTLSIISLACLACLGFTLISLQYKVTELCLQIPALEEVYYQKKQKLEDLELACRMLKNPKTLFESHALLKTTALVFPKQGQIMALVWRQEPQVFPSQDAKLYLRNLPIAKVFP